MTCCCNGRDKREWVIRRSLLKLLCLNVLKMNLSSTVLRKHLKNKVHRIANDFDFDCTRFATSRLTNRGRDVVTWQTQGACSREVRRGRKASKLLRYFTKNASHHKLAGKYAQSRCYWDMWDISSTMLLLFFIASRICLLSCASVCLLHCFMLFHCVSAHSECATSVINTSKCFVS